LILIILQLKNITTNIYKIIVLAKLQKKFILTIFFEIQLEY